MAKDDFIDLTWQMDTPHFNTYEDTRDGGFGPLTTDYALGVDTRFRGRVFLGPALNTVSLAAAGGTAATSNGMAIHTVSGTVIGWIIRGTKWAKVNLATMALISDNSESALTEAATSILKTRNAAGTFEISIGMAATAYRVITAFTTGATDTHSANASTYIARIIAEAYPSATIMLLGRGTTATENIIGSNILTGSVTMATPTPNTRSTQAGGMLQFTGGTSEDSFWYPCTDEGPLFLSERFNEFRPMIPEAANSTEHCTQATRWSFLGAMFNMANALRAIRNGEGQSVGVERWQGNNSPVTPRVTAMAGSDRWFYTANTNVGATVTYILAWRKWERADGHNNSPITPFVIGSTSNAVGFIQNIEKQGSRTLPTIVAGDGTNMMWWSEGRTSNYVDDSSYTFGTSGTWYGTESRRLLHWDKEIDYVELAVTNASATNTVQVQVSIDGATAVNLGGPITASGAHRIMVPRGQDFRGTRIKPSVVLAGSSSSTPVLDPPELRMRCRVAAKRVDGEYVPGERP